MKRNPSHTAKARELYLMTCTWCLQEATTKDHIFPRCLGGTLELAVPSCEPCQTAISVGEGYVARTSRFALYRLNRGPAPRHKERPESGAAEPKYVSVKDPNLGGYNEVALCEGGNPLTLPSIEVDLNTAQMRRKGQNPEAQQKLVDALNKLLSRSPDANGVLGEIHVDLLTQDHGRVLSDGNWWPRVFLDLRSRLRIRARSPEEAVALMKTLSLIIGHDRFSNYSAWSVGEITAGTPHVVVLREDVVAITRVVLKIVYGLLRLHFDESELATERLNDVKIFVRGGAEEPPRWVNDITAPGSLNDQTHHMALIEDRQGTLHGLVRLYGDRFSIDLGEIRDTLLKEKLPIVAQSAHDGTRTELLGKDKARGLRLLVAIEQS